MLGNIFNQFLYQPIFKFLVILYNFIPGHDLGIVIIVLTILIKIILFPISYRGTRSQFKLSALSPQIKELQKKYKTKEEQSKELMKFYKENKVNPFSGCLPLLIQLPILIALYRVLIDILKTASASISPMFLGLIDLSKNNPVLAVIAGLSQFASSMFTLKRTSGITQPGISDKAAEKQKLLSRQMTYFFPILTVIIALKLPAGLPLYWIANTLLSLVQDYYLFKKYGRNQKSN